MPETVDQAAAFLTDLNTKLKNLEEKHELVKEKTLLLGQSFLKQEEDLKKDISELKEESKELRLDTDRLKEKIDHLIQETENFARREDLRRVEKYMKIWEPLKFVKEDEVKKMIKDALDKEKEDQEPEKKNNKNYIN